MAVSTRFGCFAVLSALLLASEPSAAKEADANPASPTAGHLLIRVLNVPPTTGADADIYMVPGALPFADKNVLIRLQRDANGYYSAILPERMGGHHVYHLALVQQGSEQAVETDANGLAVLRDVWIPELGTQALDVSVAQWGASPLAHRATDPLRPTLALSLALVLAAAMGATFAVRRYRRRSSAFAPATGSTIAEHERRRADLSVAVADLTAGAKEIERWSRAFQR